MNISMYFSVFHNMVFLELGVTAQIVPTLPAPAPPPNPKKLQLQKYPAKLSEISAMETLYIKLKCLVFFMLNKKEIN